VCDCKTTHFWDNSNCTPRNTYSEYCTQDYHCTYNVGLKCDTTNTKCICKFSTTYWDTTSSTCSIKTKFIQIKIKKIEFTFNLILVSYKSYGNTCSTIYNCSSTAGLICPTTATGCACPNTLTAYQCDCPTTHYYETLNSTCTTRSTEGGKCTVGKDYMCEYNTELTCVLGLCKCATTNYYWTGAVCRKLFLFHFNFYFLIDCIAIYF
jgi:hypothetical protein